MVCVCVCVCVCVVCVYTSAVFEGSKTNSSDTAQLVLHVVQCLVMSANVHWGGGGGWFCVHLHASIITHTLVFCSLEFVLQFYWRQLPGKKGSARCIVNIGDQTNVDLVLHRIDFALRSERSQLHQNYTKVRWKKDGSRLSISRVFT